MTATPSYGSYERAAPVMARPTGTARGNSLESARWQAADFQELKPQRLDRV